jgi:hypothetical protein
MRVELKFYVATVAALPDFTSPVTTYQDELPRSSPVAKALVKRQTIPATVAAMMASSL